MLKRKTKNNRRNKLNSVLNIQLISLSTYLIFFALLSAICLKVDISKDNVCYASMTFIAVSSFVSGFISGIKERKNGIIVGLMSAMPLNVLLIAVSIALNSFSIDLNILLSLVIGVILSATGGIISVNLRLK